MVSSYNLPKTAANLRNHETNTLMRYSNWPSSLHVENGSFLSLDNLDAGYNFSLAPGSAFSKIRIYLAGNNLFYITKYKGSDPNPRYTDIAPNLGTFNNPLVPGFDRTNTWARTRSFTAGVNVIF
jgi:iron complex outermembrane receptor protein